jgi:hypothetical protein
MASTASRKEFVSLVVEEIASGIDHAVDYWLGRIDQEISDRSLTSIEQVQAIQRILREYRTTSGKLQLNCASA